MDTDKINKTIVVSYDDITRMREFSCKKGEGVTRDFMDWYLKENTFFSKTGMLIIEDILWKDPKNKFCVAFDFNNTDNPEFSMYDYYTQNLIYNYNFNREDNMSMKDIYVNVKWKDEKYFNRSNKAIFYNEELLNKLNKEDEPINKRLTDLIEKTETVINIKSSKEEYLSKLHKENIEILKQINPLLQEIIDEKDILSKNVKINIKNTLDKKQKQIEGKIKSIQNDIKNLNYESSKLITENKKLKPELTKISKENYSDIYYYMLKQSVYFCYATMYYFAKSKSKEITGYEKEILLENGIGKQINALYKYTGYININDAKIYKPIIEKDDNEPTRQYGRHIEKWSVRGHYRRVNGKMIWIEAHEKGEGELEKRIYGTEKESEVNVLPKVFEVERNIINKDIIREKTLEAPVDGVPKLTYIFDKPTKNPKGIIEKKEIDIRKHKKINFLHKLFSFFKRITKQSNTE